MTAFLKLKREQDGSQRVRTIEPDSWIETDAQGHYADIGSTEEQEIIEELRKSPWEDVVADRFANKHPWLYSVISDRARSVFLDFMPIKKGGRYLDVGSGWGQISIPLSRDGDVFCLDVTLPRLNILKEIARQENAVLHYLCGNFCTFPFEDGQFDLVIFNGALEWIALGLPGRNIRETQRDALKKTSKILSSGGLVYIGIENSLGLKYLLGAPDDHTGMPYLMMNDEVAARAMYAKSYPDQDLRAKTWSLVEYKKLLAEAGLEIVEIYGCFPDYKIIRQMIPLGEVDAVLAESGMPYPEHSGVDGSKLSFNELLGPVYRLLARNGIAQYFCPSFGIVGRKS